MVTIPFYLYLNLYIFLTSQTHYSQLLSHTWLRVSVLYTFPLFYLLLIIYYCSYLTTIGLYFNDSRYLIPEWDYLTTIPVISISYWLSLGSEQAHVLRYVAIFVAPSRKGLLRIAPNLDYHRIQPNRGYQIWVVPLNMAGVLIGPRGTGKAWELWSRNLPLSAPCQVLKAEQGLHITHANHHHHRLNERDSSPCMFLLLL